MPEYNEIFTLRDGLDGPDGDFESRVYAKIRRKKTQRKVGLGLAAVVGLAMLLSLFQLFRPLPGRLPMTAAGDAKEVVPVSENLFFSASDSRTRYSLEPVAYQKKVGAQDAALNQI